MLLCNLLIPSPRQLFLSIIWVRLAAISFKVLHVILANAAWQWRKLPCPIMVDGASKAKGLSSILWAMPTKFLKPLNKALLTLAPW